jgi:two-component system sensor histidine kinase YesM
MQKRYENRISFNIKMDDDVSLYAIPKITLQQFVENAITHNFEAGLKEIDIDIQCLNNAENDTQTSGDASGWCLCIRDNGFGFSPDVLLRLKNDIEELKSKLLDQGAEFQIGGMGILNTFARLWLFFGDNIELELGNNPKGGAYVLISKKGDG